VVKMSVGEHYRVNISRGSTNEFESAQQVGPGSWKRGVDDCEPIGLFNDVAVHESVLKTVNAGGYVARKTRS
jgi:hypothetical protein